jgi:hypothetical protein
MAQLHLWSLVLLAIGPAIFIASFSGRLNSRLFKAAVLAVVAIPSLSIGYMAIDAWLHRNAGTGAVIGGGIFVCGLGLAVLAARFGHRLSAGRGLAVLMLMAVLPIAAFLALLLRTQATIKQQVLERTFDEEVQVADRLTVRDHQQRTLVMREVPARRAELQRCTRDLSAAGGRAAAQADQKRGKLQLMVLKTYQQELLSQRTPGIDHLEFDQYPPDGRLVIKSKGPKTAARLQFTITDPPYGLWSDPWGRYAFVGLNRYISDCDTAVNSYSAAYNRTMLTLNRVLP